MKRGRKLRPLILLSFYGAFCNHLSLYRKEEHEYRKLEGILG